MKVSTLIIVSIPIVLGLQIKDTVGTTTENTFWYQLFGTPSRSQPAAVAATAAGTEVQDLHRFLRLLLLLLLLRLLGIKDYLGLAVLH